MVLKQKETIDISSKMGCIRCTVFSFIRQISYIKYTFVKECLKTNILLYVLPKILPLNLIDLYFYGYQILDSFSINEFAWIRCTLY